MSESPACWDQQKVVEWARGARLPDPVICSLQDNEIDGSVLLTLQKTDLKAELAIRSLAVRRFLWDAIERLKTLHDLSDHEKALHLHSDEIVNVASAEEKDSLDPLIIQMLNEDLREQNQILSDSKIALAMDGSGVKTLQFHQDIQRAAECQVEMDRLRLQEDYDLQYAKTLSPTRTHRANNPGVQSLAALCIKSCVTNRVNVAEALANGTARVIPRGPPSASPIADPEEEESAATSMARAPARTLARSLIRTPATARAPALARAPARASATALARVPARAPTRASTAALARAPARASVASARDYWSSNYGIVGNDDDRKMPAREYPLPFINCYSCLDENIRGFSFACEHASCKPCLTRLFKAALRDVSLLPLVCCELPIDMGAANHCLSADDSANLTNKLIEIEAKNKIYCPCCSAFINLDFVDLTESTFLSCPTCTKEICCKCVMPSHPHVSCETYKKMSKQTDEEFEALVSNKGWKKCPGCNAVIALRSGCNHMTCALCSTEFCYQCRSPWSSESGLCTSGNCARWEEQNLFEAGQQRVRVQENAAGRLFRPAERERRVAQATRQLYHNETCNHAWRRQNLTGSCERCGYDLWAYGMVCRAGCGSTVCYTCAHHRIPQRGWR